MVATYPNTSNRDRPARSDGIDVPFYFERNGCRLYGLYYPARGQPNGTGIVLCNGFGKEYEIARTALSVIARDLASRGYSCLRFDYGGYADSEGNFEDTTVTSMRDDIEAALDELARRSGSKRLALLGIRLGGTLAALVAARRHDVSSLILWEPLVRPWDTLFAALRHTVAMQSVIFGKVVHTREQIVANVLEGRPSLAGGYNFNIIDEGFPLAGELVRELQKIDLVSRPPTIKARTLILNIVKSESPVSKELASLASTLTRAGAPCDIASAIVPCLPWVHERIFARQFPTVFDRTSSWLEG